MRNTLRGIVSACKRYGLLSKKEALSVLYVSIVFGFIFGFRMWGDPFDAVLGIYNWIMFSIFSATALIVMIIGNKIMAYEMGYFTEFKHWRLGLTLNTLICFLTNGWAVFLTPGGFELKRNEGTQIGKCHWGVIYFEKAFLVFWGFFAIVLYAILVKIIFPYKLAQSITTTAFLIGIWSLAPIDIVLKFFFKEAPNSNGTCLITGPKSFAIFTVVFFIIAMAINYYFTAFWPLIIALVIGVICYSVFYVFIDPQKKLYK